MFQPTNQHIMPSAGHCRPICFNFSRLFSCRQFWTFSSARRPFLVGHASTSPDPGECAEPGFVRLRLLSVSLWPTLHPGPCEEQISRWRSDTSDIHFLLLSWNISPHPKHLWETAIFWAPAQPQKWFFWLNRSILDNVYTISFDEISILCMW